MVWIVLGMKVGLVRSGWAWRKALGIVFPPEPIYAKRSGGDEVEGKEGGRKRQRWDGQKRTKPDLFVCSFGESWERERNASGSDDARSHDYHSIHPTTIAPSLLHTHHCSDFPMGTQVAPCQIHRLRLLHPVIAKAVEHPDSLQEQIMSPKEGTVGT